MPEPNDSTENVKATEENSSENTLHDYEWMVWTYIIVTYLL